MPTKIEWCEESWNPITGCTPVSEGCAHCYARRIAQRFKGRYGYPSDDPFQVTFHPDRLDEPLKWKKPRHIFVCSMGDLFHEDVSEYDILAVWQKMGEFHDPNGQILPVEKRPGHTYLVLTKRPERALDFLSRRYPEGFARRNVWLGVTAENQQRADERIPVLLQIPAAKRFVSIEPMLGPVDISYPLNGGPEQNGYGEWYQTFPPLDWVILGGETGPGARPMHPDWPRKVRDQCREANIPFFFKHWGEWEHRPLMHSTPWDKRFKRVGKKAAGRLLDGREWNEKPEK